jgi:hypothetical protein
MLSDVFGEALVERAMIDLAVGIPCGGAIGFDRQRRGRPAGMRTCIIVGARHVTACAARRHARGARHGGHRASQSHRRIRRHAPPDRPRLRRVPLLPGRRPSMTIPRFEDLYPLLPAEKMIIDGLGSGQFDVVEGGRRPGEDDRDHEVRAGFLRLLLIGAPGAPPIHEKGLRVAGALITGSLDLEGCRLQRDLGAVDCRFAAAPVLRSARIQTLFLDGSVLPGLLAERLEARGDLMIRSAAIMGVLAIPGARIGGALVLDGTGLRSEAPTALDATGIEARGGVLLRDSRISGGIQLVNSWLLGDLDATGAQLAASEGPSIIAAGADIRGDVQLRHAWIKGRASFVGTRCKGDIDLTSAHLESTGGGAFDADRAEIGGALILRGEARIDGLLSLNGTRIGAIVDEPSSWPAPGNLALNRCSYSAIMDPGLDVGSRLDWLSREAGARSPEEFLPGPYEQLSEVLSVLGHNEDAREVLFVKEKLQRRARRRRARSPLTRGILWLSDALLGLTLGYGRRPMLAIAWLLLFWMSGTGVMLFAEASHAIRPNNAFILRAPEWMLCDVPEGESFSSAAHASPLQGRARPGESQIACFLRQPEAKSFPAFNAPMYAIDTLLPAVDTGQREFWAADGRFPAGRAARIFAYVLTIMGWVLGLLAVAGFSGLIRSR